jgi:SAM-dependent methyltransferase
VQDFFHLDLPAESFNGVFANAALFHIPKEVLPQVLSDLWTCLKPGGILFSSNPRGNNEAHWFGERFGLYHDLEGWRHYMSKAHFVEIEHYYRPSGLPFEQQPWLASVWKKTI